jgi:hypothetical protein
MPGCIHYFCRGSHSYTLGIFAGLRATAIKPALRIIPYEELHRIRSFGPGAFIFTDFERISTKDREALAGLIGMLDDAGCTVLNHPLRTLDRFPLLRRLHEAAINRFNVHRFEDWRQVERWPVFLRHEHRHRGPMTKLLPDPATLRNAMRMVAKKFPNTGELMIVEFGNVPFGDGRFRKYSAFRVGKHIYASECLASPNWLMKFTHGGQDEADAAENARFLEEQPHRDQLARIFDLAGVDYGRADYCVVDGQVQLFEINTNPAVSVAYPQGGNPVRYAARFEAALLALHAAAAGPAATDNVLFGRPEAETTLEEMTARIVEEGMPAWRARWRGESGDSGG